MSVLFVGSYWMLPTQDQIQIEETFVEDTLQAPVYVPNFYYGIVVDSLQVFEGEIQRNGTLADILAPFNVPYEKINLAAKNSKAIFDVRKFVVRKPYSILYQGDSLNKSATHFIYRPNAIDYVVFDFRDSVSVYKGVREIRLVERELAGEIQTSLYVDMLNQGGDVDLVNNLVDVFGWQVDFFGIQKGDNYKIIYDEQYVDDEYIGSGKIKAAYFNHINQPYYGVHFDQGDGQDYFSKDGNSLRREFLKAPLTFTRISSRYTGRRYHPVQKRFKAHLGTDYAAPRGTPIFAASDGVITEARYKSNNGNYVKINHNGNIATQYLHMSKIATGMKPGVKVKRGQTIGYVGSTGLATGPHLCYRFWKNGVQVDALKVELPPSEPIMAEYRSAFDSLSSLYISRLNQINLPLKQQEVLTAVATQ
ncbi:peptidoglycan DD-metalloendopeptidase family protein [Reichenbachiella agarivorans]|uniref:Peptidoglycan DD-metalloendopeptidase family protein n=1 Tax=Reichenbachiella agarivorans TaxID=2979464 RepID=A0ABY6CT48_9BACT|nr:peptidoglycan DD-metalloendopeptidase family protein [Reichenbachiella agarivorans]UXP33692.1 peptidoglycan DD-metalloendopeptidase family protein [Reichenbachiella agarivorans]